MNRHRSRPHRGPRLPHLGRQPQRCPGPASCGGRRSSEESVAQDSGSRLFGTPAQSLCRHPDIATCGGRTPGVEVRAVATEVTPAEPSLHGHGLRHGRAGLRDRSLGVGLGRRKRCGTWRWRLDRRERVRDRRTHASRLPVWTQLEPRGKQRSLRLRRESHALGARRSGGRPGLHARGPGPTSGWARSVSVFTSSWVQMFVRARRPCTRPLPVLPLAGGARDRVGRRHDGCLRARPTTGWFIRRLPVDPKKAASPKAKMPPSDATIQ